MRPSKSSKLLEQYRRDSTQQTRVYFHSKQRSDPELQSSALPDRNTPTQKRTNSENRNQKSQKKPSVTKSSDVSRTKVSRPTCKLPPSSSTMSGSQALRENKHKLTPFEQSEILYYRHVYFLPSCRRDDQLVDDEGDFKITEGNQIQYRYEIKSILGRGSFGQVVQVYDHKTHKDLAIKIIKNVAKLKEQAKLEVKILSLLRKREHLVQIFDFFSFRDHICITFELLHINLYQHLKLRNFRGLSEPSVKTIALQLFRALRTLWKGKIVHCDVKPENILFESAQNSTVKLIDFGSSCFENQQIYSYVQSRYYRAPEVVLQIKYDRAIDTWSLGCVLVELFIGRPLFRGQSQTDHFMSIVETLGHPPKELIAKGLRSSLFFNPDGSLKSNKNTKKSTRRNPDIDQILENASSGFRKFIKKCLQWRPETRISPEDALNDEWLSNHRRVGISV